MFKWIMKYSQEVPLNHIKLRDSFYVFLQGGMDLDLTNKIVAAADSKEHLLK